MSIIESNDFLPQQPCLVFKGLAFCFRVVRFCSSAFGWGKRPFTAMLRVLQTLRPCSQLGVNLPFKGTGQCRGQVWFSLGEVVVAGIVQVESGTLLLIPQGIGQPPPAPQHHSRGPEVSRSKAECCWPMEQGFSSGRAGQESTGCPRRCSRISSRPESETSRSPSSTSC